MGLLRSVRCVLRRDARAGAEQPPFPTDRPSIFRALEARREAAGEVYPLPEFELPDTARYRAATNCAFDFGPGSRDDSFDQHASESHTPETVGILLAALKRACKRPGRRSALALHDVIPKEQVLGLIDPLLGELRDAGLDAANLLLVARWLATESPDREPVKLGIALLGAQNGDDDHLLFTLGSHDEFTLYSAAAFRRRYRPAEADRALWMLARMTSGWGRVQAIDHMSAAPPPEVADWLLREGEIHWLGYGESTLRDRATRGNLLQALRRRPAPDNELLVGAGEILAMMTTGMPPAQMAGYADGAEAAKAWIRAEAPQPPDDLRRLLVLGTLRTFAMAEEGDWSELKPLGWTAEMRLALAEAAGRSICERRWETLVRRDLDADGSATFWRAAQAARVLGVDPWEHAFARLRDDRSDDSWRRRLDGRGSDFCWLMQTDDPARAGRVAALAEQRMRLDAIAIGPTMAIGYERVFDDPSVSDDASTLDSIVKALERFPGIGAPIVLASLKCPAYWNRVFAVDTLGVWPRESWPPEIETAVAAATEAEPEPKLRARMEALRDARKPPGWT